MLLDAQARFWCALAPVCAAMHEQAYCNGLVQLTGVPGRVQLHTALFVQGHAAVSIRTYSQIHQPRRAR